MSRKSKPGITPEMFTQLYMESWRAGHTVRQFAERVHLSPVAVHGRVRHYRRKGIAFPQLAAGHLGRPPVKRLPVKEMNSIISRALEYRPELPDAVRPAGHSNGRLVGSVS